MELHGKWIHSRGMSPKAYLAYLVGVLGGCWSRGDRWRLLASKAGVFC